MIEILTYLQLTCFYSLTFSGRNQQVRNYIFIPYPFRQDMDNRQAKTGEAQGPEGSHAQGSPQTRWVHVA